MFVSKVKLGYTLHEANHIYIGEYTDQFIVYKKYHNMEMNKVLFTESEKEVQIKEETPPNWVVEEERKLANGK